MTAENLTIKATIQIAKAPSEVFDAIVQPEKMAQYFIARGSATLERGAQVTWQFPEFDDVVPVTVSEANAPLLVRFEWDGSPVQKTTVNIQLKAVESGTIITVTEESMPNTADGIKWLTGNTEGWANFLACMKAYLEYNINLRTGAFDYMRQQ